jgi:hypothetical protein
VSVLESGPESVRVLVRVLGIGAGVDSRVGSGVDSGVGAGVGSGVGLGVGSGVSLGIRGLSQFGYKFGSRLACPTRLCCWCYYGSK